MKINRNDKIDFNYVLITALAVLLSWISHELAHGLMGESLGYVMGMSFNKCFPVDGSFKSQQDYQMVSAAGPVFTLIQAIFIFILMKYRHSKLLYPFLFTCFYMRFFATIISIINPNDEARISKWLGLGKFTLPILMSALLFLYFILSQNNMVLAVSLTSSP